MRTFCAPTNPPPVRPTPQADSEAAQYVGGIGVHWYAAVEDDTPSALYFGKLAETHDKHPGPFNETG